MKRHKFALLLACLFLLVWFFHSPIADKLTQDEINHYLNAIQEFPFPPEEKAEILDRIRAWALADDGKPVFMLNLMRYYDQIQPGAPEFHGTAEEQNKYFTKKVLPILFKRLEYPMVLAYTQGKNLVGIDPAIDNWSEVVLVRYPNRKAFLRLLADPTYQQIIPYKLTAVKLYLTPLSGKILIPDMRWIVGGVLLTVFLAVGWIKAARRNKK